MKVLALAAPARVKEASPFYMRKVEKIRLHNRKVFSDSKKKTLQAAGLLK